MTAAYTTSRTRHTKGAHEQDLLNCHCLGNPAVNRCLTLPLPLWSWTIITAHFVFQKC
jgi:hypothetical protein